MTVNNYISPLRFSDKKNVLRLTTFSLKVSAIRAGRKPDR
jgi:hypothetical protein